MRKKYSIWIGLLLAGLSINLISVGEGCYDSLLVQKIERYKNNHPMEMVYLQTDRDSYSPGTNILFKAYISDYYSAKPGFLGKDLQLILLDPEGKRVFNESFPIENGQSAGRLTLGLFPDIGEYSLIAYTDVMQNGDPANIFVKKIYVRIQKFPDIFIKLSVPGKVYSPSEEVRVDVELVNLKGEPIRKSFDYKFMLNGEQFADGSGKSDKNGKAVIVSRLIEFKRGSVISLEVDVNNAGIKDNNSILIPTEDIALTLKFYPEGGSLLDGIKARIGFLALDPFGDPQYIEGQILNADNKVLSEFKSLDYGLGSFTIIPDLKNPLKVKITKPAGISQLFSLPTVKSRGLSLVLDSRDDDQLFITIHSNLNDAYRMFHLIAELDGQIVWDKQLSLSDRTSIIIPVKDMSGLLRITLIDENGKVIAHRALLQDKAGSRVSIIPDRGKYFSNEKISLGVQVNNENGQPVSTDLSIAVTDANMDPDWNSDADIFSYFKLGSFAINIPLPPGYMIDPAPEQKNIIDCLLLFMSKEKYIWEEVLDKQKPTVNISGDQFLADIMNYFKLGEHEELIKEIRKDQFFYKYILKYNQVFPEFMDVNRRMLNRINNIAQVNSEKIRVRSLLSKGTPIMEVIMTIKPFRVLNGGEIIFHGPVTLQSSKGALFVIDGTPMGTDPFVLKIYDPADIENIEVLTDPVDVLRYTAYNTVGIINITTKKVVNVAPITEIQPITIYDPTFFWNPFVNTILPEIIAVTFNSSDMKSIYNVIVQGVDSGGRPIYGKSQFSVY